MKPAFHSIFTTAFVCLSILLTAQIEHGGEPFAWHDKSPARAALVPFYTTDALAYDLIAAQDAVTDPIKEVPYRFGWEWEVDLNLSNSGVWTDLNGGDRIWQLGIACPEATSISFIFDQYNLPKGAKLFIWNAERTSYKGAFTHKNNKEWGSLGVGLLHDESVIIELYEPASVAGETVLSIGTIVHGYRSIIRAEDRVEVERGPFGNSGACNINVNCPIAADWQVEKRSVALIVNGGFAQCSGALVNNTAMDGTPYFLTANHCLGGQNNWVFYFNHEASGCNGSTGPTSQSVSGSVLRANRANTDFALLELSSTPPSSFNVQYSGWDRTDALTVTSAVGIHHPSGDVKKICFEDNSPFHQNVGGAACWYINQWEEGVTEGGSSGSPLYDQNHRIIGQLYGGFAACAGSNNNGAADWYGRFGMSWNGNSPNQRLRDWLDPTGSNPSVLDGFPDGFTAAEYDAGIGTVGNVNSTVCGDLIYPTVTLVNNGTATLTTAQINVILNGVTVHTIDWSGTLNQGQSETVNLPGVAVTAANNTLTITVTSPNGQTDENPANNTSTVQFTAVVGPTLEFTLDLILDDYGAETTWELTNESGQVLFEGGPYGDGLDGTLVQELFCIPEGCYTFTIFDEWGDGICCGWGEGSWTLINWNNVAIGSGGEFDEVETFTFCTDEVSVSERGLEQAVLLYPNPAGQAVTLELPDGVRELFIFDVAGRIVHHEVTNGATRMVLDVSRFAPGRYVLQSVSDTRTHTNALIIQR